LLTGSGLAVWKWTAAAPVLTPASSSERDVLVMPAGPSIAALPFERFSSDPEQEYFADGIVETF
jgi:TolB-like protein